MIKDSGFLFENLFIFATSQQFFRKIRSDWRRLTDKKSPNAIALVISLITPLSATMCSIQITSAIINLATRAIVKGGLEEKDYREVADIVAPAVVSGSKESISAFGSAFMTWTGSVSLVTTADGKIQLFTEVVTRTRYKNLYVTHAASMPGVGVSVTHGYVDGLYDEVQKVYDPLRYSGPATQGNLSIPLPPYLGGACGPYFEGYISDDRKVRGIDFGAEIGIGPTILGTAHTNAKKQGNKVVLSGKGLLLCRLISMCGALAQ